MAAILIHPAWPARNFSQCVAYARQQGGVLVVFGCRYLRLTGLPDALPRPTVAA